MKKRILSLLLVMVLAISLAGNMIPTVYAFTPRTTAPSETDKHWIHTSHGGLNECIIINSSTGSCIPNCVGYAWGRAYEILGHRPDLCKGDAWTWYSYNKNKYDNNNGGYPYSSDVTKPAPGAIVVWSRSGKAGHVAVVESVSGSTVVTSESGYGGSRFWTTTRTTTNTNLSQSSAYHFLGYIYTLGANLEPEEPRMWCEDINLPFELMVGSDFNLTGTIHSNNGVKWFALVIYDSNNNVVQNVGEDVWRIESTNCFSINSLAQSLDFASLSTGSYRLSIQSLDNDNTYYTSYEKAFQVNEAKMWCEDVTMPSYIATGTSLALDGSICSNNGVKWFALVIYNENNEVVQNVSEDVWRVENTNSYSMGTLSQSLDFSALLPGSYRLSVQSMDNDNNYFGAYEKAFTVSDATMWCENISIPSEFSHGASVSLTGNICSNNGVKWFALVIYNSNNEVVQNVDEAVWKVANTNNYSINTLAQSLDFSSLPAADYRLSIQGLDNNNTYFTAYEKVFVVTPATMWCEDVTLPTEIVYGKDINLTGTICGTNGVKWYALVIYDSNNNDIQNVDEAVWTVANTNSYSINTLAQSLDFSSLSKGTYRLSIQSLDNDNVYYTAYEKPFVVGDAKMWCEDINMPAGITYGKDFDLTGNIWSSNGVKWYAIVIYDSNNNVVKNIDEAVWAITNTNCYSINSLADTLDFSTLSKGSYRLSIQSMDNDNNYYGAYEKAFIVDDPTMWCEDVDLPDQLAHGTSYNLSGSIVSNNGVKWYALVIYDSNNEAIQNIGEDVWRIANTYSYPINTLAQSLDFSSLSVGEYRLSIQSMDYDNNYFGAFEKAFSVVCQQHTYIERTVEPTCSDQGYTIHACAVCGYSYTDNYTPSLAHNYSFAVTTTPTTISTGLLTGTCSRCNGQTTVTLPQLNTTDYIYSVVTAATCTANGTGRYTWKTTTYGTFTFDVTIPQTEHSYTYAVTTAPTTSATGVLTGTCPKCSGTTTVTLPKLNTTDYTYSVVTAATCTANGTGRYTWKTTTYGTFYFDVTLPKTNHSYADTVTPPSCTEQGYTTHICSVCGDSYVDSYVSALGHSFGAWTQTVAPTCTDKGSETRACSRCGATETREVNALGHDLIHHPAQAPTCTAIGWDAYDTCSRCDYTTYVEKAALEHNYQDAVTAPNCTEQGYTTHTCSRCGDSYVDSYVEAVGHKPVTSEENRVNPTCTENGGFDTVTYCSVCNAELGRSHTDLAALGHLWDDGVINPAPNCTTDGVKTYTCQRCGEAKTEAIAATGHTQGEAVKENAVAATCTTAGGYDMVIRCTVCDAILYTEHFEIAALGHDYQAVVTQPICTEGGYTTYTCSRCGDSYVADETEPTGHTPAEPVKEDETAATCLDAGGYDMVVYCAVCGAELSREHTEIPATGHDWDAPTYEWAEDYSEITATRTCKNNTSHIETEKGVITSEVTLEATVDAEGEITYTATFTNPAFETQTKKVATPKLEKPDDGLPCDGSDSCPGNKFTDMPAKGNWAHDPIDWAVVHGVTAGTSATTFSPNAGCTRAQVVTFLWRAAGTPEPTSTNNPFKDVKEGAYYYKAVLWAVENKVTAGTAADKFSPDATCTRAQIVTFLWRYEGNPEPTTTDNPFKDVKPGAYYEKAVLWASETGVTAGTSATTFSPDATCTRAQVVTFLYRDVEN